MSNTTPSTQMLRNIISSATPFTQLIRNYSEDQNISWCTKKMCTQNVKVQENKYRYPQSKHNSSLNHT